MIVDKCPYINMNSNSSWFRYICILFQEILFRSLTLMLKETIPNQKDSKKVGIPIL